MTTELDVRLRARGFVSSSGLVDGMPDMAAYAKEARVRIRYEELDEGEAGFTINGPKGFVITVNSAESLERQRFTVCHEIAHIILGLPSTHQEMASSAIAKRDTNEVWCDIFATELLMPYSAFSSRIPPEEPSEQVIETLAREFGASFPAAASRYSSLVAFPSAYITMSGNFVRYAGVNAAMRRRGLNIPMKTVIPQGALAHRLRKAGTYATEVEQIAQDVWLANAETGYDMWELCRHYGGRYDETISLLWCDEEELPFGEVDRFNRRQEEDTGLEELDGHISWEKHGPRRKR